MKVPTSTRPATSASSAARPESRIGTKEPTKAEEAKKTEMKRAPSKPINNAPAGPKSVEQDEVDDIYKEEDPIEASLNKRKKAGAIA